MALRQHSVAELRLKLARRGYTVDQVNQAVQRLDELGYLDDRAYARSLLGRRAASRGRQAIAAELAHKGIDRAVAGEVLAELDTSDELEAATRLAIRLGGPTPGPTGNLLKRIGPKLVRRGFSHSVVAAACARVTSSHQAD